MPRRSLILATIALAAFAATSSSLLDLAPPIDGLTLPEIRDMFAEIHNGHAHEAIDIMEPRGTPVHAVVNGRIQKLFLSKAGGNTIYQFDENEVYCYYYAHLDHYAPGLAEGAVVKQGDIIAFVGSTGNANADAPHLHFAVFELGSEKHWWQGKPIDPYPALVQAVKRNSH